MHGFIKLDYYKTGGDSYGEAGKVYSNADSWLAKSCD